MRHELWNKPIEVSIDAGDHFKTVGNSREALQFLMTCWPKKGGERFNSARRICMEVLEGNADPAAAELAFIAAAKDAGILR